jgi:pilus assembly protein CpaF
MMRALEQVLGRSGVSDVVINGSRGMWVDAGSGLHRESGWQASEVEVRRLARELVARGGRHLDEAHPCVDVRAGDGIRVHAVLPPVSGAGTLISIRVAGQKRTLRQLADTGMMTTAQCDKLAAVVRAGQTLLICGAAGSGKTTLLGAALSQAGESERVIVLEDVAELGVAHPHVVTLETRQANIEGAGALGMSELVRQALRMRPDRLVLGECRGAELGEFMAALNTGHGGGGTTLHANSLTDVPRRLEALGLLAGLAPAVLARQAVTAFDAVIFLERGAAGRQLAGMGALQLGADGVLECTLL